MNSTISPHDVYPSGINDAYYTLNTPMSVGNKCLPPNGWAVWRRSLQGMTNSALKPDFLDASPETIRSMGQDYNWILSRTKYKADMSQEDRWRIAEGEGDCEDIALKARAWFVAVGYPLGAFRIAACHTHLGTGHAVLVVTTRTLGDWVMDNRYAGIKRWYECPYTWVCREVPGAFKWERIINS